MDDLTLVRELADDTPPPDLGPARARLMARIATQRPRRRFGPVIAAVATGTAAAAAVVVVSTSGGPAAPAPDATATDPVRLLAAAADAARAQPWVAPRPDQFVYTRTGSREFWRSVDGTHDGLLIDGPRHTPMPGCRNGRTVVVQGDEIIAGRTDACEVSPGYRADLPTTEDGMVAYLQRVADNPNSRGKEVLGLIEESVLAPATRAALYQAAARTPGLTAVPNVTNGSGTPGVGVTWPPPGGDPTTAVTLVFDPDTHEYLGTTDSTAGHPSIVDTVGARP
ncbi:CU044_5270 family protein [Actinokineospora enzanensis]|uniref:CU044_5270 family protein n=1 Tax=Actinokineospora enzanensis TaxID=155975 RepID=UPI00037ED55B|nr:CU044_5270 family protein [Actinokineospora enzanensis]